jgi:hypothetical protein
MKHKKNKKEARRIHEQLDASGESAERFLQAMQPTPDSYDHWGRLMSYKSPSAGFEAVQDRNEHGAFGENTSYFTEQSPKILQTDQLWCLDENLRVLPHPMLQSKARPWTQEHQCSTDSRVSFLDWQQSYTNMAARPLLERHSRKPLVLETVPQIQDVRNQSSIRESQYRSQTAGPNHTLRRTVSVRKVRVPLSSTHANLVDRVQSPIEASSESTDQYIGRQPKGLDLQYTGGFEDRYNADLAITEQDFEQS